MMRGISIFALFTLSTVLVIVLQPGPRDDFSNQPNAEAFVEASRNQTLVFDDQLAAPFLAVPDEVISQLKARAQPQRAVAPAPAPAETGASLTRLQAALSASINTDAAVSDALANTAAPQPVRQQPQVAIQAIAPELRDMSWQTLNALNNIGHVSKAPGQQGSLLNSIVRRSMGHVDGTRIVAPTSSPSVVSPVTNTVTAAVTAPVQQAVRSSTTLTRASNNYTVSSGDTLALIAIKLYGSALATDRLLEDNLTLRQNPNALRIGQQLKYRTP